MLDISYAGAKIYLSTRAGDSVGPITEFSDEGSPVEIPDIDIADGNMNLNGILVTWTKAQAAEFSLTLIPNSQSEKILATWLSAHAIGGRGAIPEAFIDQLQLVIPANVNVSGTSSKNSLIYTFKNGRMRRGAPATGTNSEGKMNAKTYNFIFEQVMSVTGKA